MLQHTPELTLDKEVVQLFWMMCGALERRTDLSTVLTTGVQGTAHTLKMLVFAAKSLVSANLCADNFYVADLVYNYFQAGDIGAFTNFYNAVKAST